MRLFFDDIIGETRRYSISDDHLFPSSEENLVVQATATIFVSRQDKETVFLEGKLEGRRRAVCDRCGEQLEEKLQSEFVYLVTTRQEESLGPIDQECTDEDALVLYLREPFIEIEEILREQALLSVPLRTLCSEDCKGICAGCGLVLNRESCRCQPDKSDSPFAVLKNLKNR
jgi:uncharacterized protein